MLPIFILKIFVLCWILDIISRSLLNPLLVLKFFHRTLAKTTLKQQQLNFQSFSNQNFQIYFKGKVLMHLIHFGFFPKLMSGCLSIEQVLFLSFNKK